jgi:hypothetical protein
VIVPCMACGCVGTVTVEGALCCPMIACPAIVAVRVAAWLVPESAWVQQLWQEGMCWAQSAVRSSVVLPLAPELLEQWSPQQEW